MLIIARRRIADSGGNSYLASVWMSIEFPCAQCGKLLRVGDDAAGKQARCPSCGSVQAIPGATAPVRSPFGASAHPQVPPAAAPVSDNPYQSPATASWYPSQDVPAGSTQQMTMDAGDVLSRTWTIFKSDFWTMALVGFVFWVCQAGFGFVVGQVVQFSIMGARGGQLTPADLFTSQAILQTISFLFTTWLEAGMAIYMLKVARGRAAELGDLFAGARFWPVAVVARFLTFLAVFCGSLLLIVPGIILALMFSQMYYLVVDRQLGIVESLSMSKTITSGNKLQLFVLVLATVGVGLMGALACCVGTFPAIAFIALMWAVAYLTMTGEPTAESRLFQPPPSTPFQQTVEGELR